MSFCPKCGSEVKEGSLFCTNCGATVTPRASATVKPAGAKKSAAAWVFAAIALVLAIVLVLQNLGLVGTLRGSGTADRLEGPGSDSAEEAVEAYIAALKEADFEKAASTFAIESYIKGYSLDEFVTRYRLYNPSLNLIPQTEGELSEEYNAMHRYAEAYETIQRDIAVFTGMEIVENPRAFGGEDEDELRQEIRDFIGRSFPEEAKIQQTLSTLEFKGFTENFEAFARWRENENAQNIYRTNWAIYGTVSMKPLVACISIGFTDYYLALDAIQYGGKWYVFGPGTAAAILGLSTFQGGACKVSELPE